MLSLLREGEGNAFIKSEFCLMTFTGARRFSPGHLCSGRGLGQTTEGRKVGEGEKVAPSFMEGRKSQGFNVMNKDNNGWNQGREWFLGRSFHAAVGFRSSDEGTPSD